MMSISTFSDRIIVISNTRCNVIDGKCLTAFESVFQDAH